jgi:hypothetical protein
LDGGVTFENVLLWDVKIVGEMTIDKLSNWMEGLLLRMFYFGALKLSVKGYKSGTTVYASNTYSF